MKRKHRNKLAGAAVMAIASVILAACGGSTSGSGSGSSAGGISLTVIEINQSWPSLGPPPATENPIFVVNYMNAIYGQLFERAVDGSIVPDLASGYQYSPDGLTLTISIRSGVKFQDGTPFNAEAVADQFERVLNPENACTCLGSLGAISSVTVNGNDVVLHLSHKDATIIQSIISQQPNWIPSPTALTKMGAEKFGQMPVGAGPFEVVSNVPSSTLVLKKNPDYWQHGLPHLDQLTFLTSASDQTAYAGLESGAAQLVMGITTPSILTQAKSQYQLSETPGVVAYQVLFNTKKPPFNNSIAREAVAYATDAAQILKSASPGFGVLSQSPTGPGGLYPEQSVPGTRTYNLAKAKQLVSQLGGLSFDFYYATNQTVYVDGAQALAREWADAGINVTLDPVTPTESSQKNKTGNWMAQFTAAGGADPDVGLTGLLNRYGSTGSLTCCADKTLDGMIRDSTSISNTAQRQQALFGIYQYINQQQYSVNLFALPTVDIATRQLTGIAASPNSTAGKEMISWQDVAIK